MDQISPILPSNTFLDVIPRGISANASPLRLLKQLAEALQQVTFADSNLRIVIEPGFFITRGQQYKFCAQILDACGYNVVYTDILFSIYIPPQGYPTTVRSKGYGPKICEDEASLTLVLFELLKYDTFRNLLYGLLIIAEKPIGIKDNC